jgi:hypothetical protein
LLKCQLMVRQSQKKEKRELLLHKKRRKLLKTVSQCVFIGPQEWGLFFGKKKESEDSLFYLKL